MAHFNVVLIRHGQKQGPPVPNDLAKLTDHGVAQVRASGRWLAERFKGHDIIGGLSSNLPRAIQTAELVLEEMGNKDQVIALAGLSYEHAALYAPTVEAEQGFDMICDLPNGKGTAQQMAETCPWISGCFHGAISGTLSAALIDANDPDEGVVVIGGHSPLIEFAPLPTGWDRVTKRAEASGLIIRIGTDPARNGFRILPGVELFDAAPLE